MRGIRNELFRQSDKLVKTFELIKIASIIRLVGITYTFFRGWFSYFFLSTLEGN